VELVLSDSECEPLDGWTRRC